MGESRWVCHQLSTDRLLREGEQHHRRSIVACRAGHRLLTTGRHVRGINRGTPAPAVTTTRIKIPASPFGPNPLAITRRPPLSGLLHLHVRDRTHGEKHAIPTPAEP